MDPKIKCLKCKSYIHDTEKCQIWNDRRLCRTDQRYKESCDCKKCLNNEICNLCNNYTFFTKFRPVCKACHSVDFRCTVCNEYLIPNIRGELKCSWDHSKPLCEFCNLPFYKGFNCCPNHHYKNYSLCEKCNMPEMQDYKHKHDGNKCKVCNNLLNHGKCINRCVNGGIFCVFCNYEGVVDNECQFCYKVQSGYLTKSAIK